MERFLSAQRARRLRTVLPPAVLAVAVVAGCTERPTPAVQGPARAAPDVTVRDIRVVILEDAPDLSIRIDGSYVVRSPASGVLAQSSNLPSTTLRIDDGFVLGPSRWSDPIIEIVPDRGTKLWLIRRAGDGWSPPAQYAGFLRCLRRSKTAMDVVNVVDLPNYLVGVLTRELYAEFQRETFRAQAVAARTYALYQMAHNADRRYDVRATEASQVYGGVPTGSAGRKAREAVRYTRGIICTWGAPDRERVFCTYYCSSCGGLTQDAANVMRMRTVKPLAGGVRCNFCRIASGNVFRWGPVKIGKHELTRRIAGRYPAVKSLGTIDKVTVSRRTRHGRPARIRLVGTTGQTSDLPAEGFRLAVGSRLMRSTNCRIETGREDVRFFDGRGFGHAIGLCQWGAEGQARIGRRAGEILTYYYPGAHLTRVY